MKIQLLHFPDCPNAEPARAALREALRQENVTEDVEDIDTSRADAPAWATGWGSPTILIDGRDLGGEGPGGAEASCRLYKEGAPTVDEIRRRLRDARVKPGTYPRTRPQGTSSLPLVGSVLAALAASACCLLPAVLAIVGVSGAGVASTLAPYRPLFLALTAVAIAAGFWFAYRPMPVDECGCGTPRSRRRTRIALWLSALLAIGFAGYPLVFDANASVHARARGGTEVTLHVTGMDCAACTKVLTKRLSRIAAVATVDVDYDHQLAVITYDGRRDISQELIDAVDDVGYQATVVR